MQLRQIINISLETKHKALLLKLEHVTVAVIAIGCSEGHDCCAAGPCAGSPGRLNLAAVTAERLQRLRACTAGSSPGLIAANHTISGTLRAQIGLRQRFLRPIAPAR